MAALARDGIDVETIRAALAATDGRRNDAAEILGISRKTRWEKIKAYGVSEP